MKTPTIQGIKRLVDQMEESLRKFIPSQHEGESYGQENEYTASFLKANLKAMIMDLHALLKAHNKFLQLSSLNERNSIISCLENICTSLESKEYPNVVYFLEELKPIIRVYRISKSSDKQNILEERISQLGDKYSDIETAYDEIRDIQQKAEQAKAHLQNAEENLGSIDEKIQESQNQYHKIEELQNQSQENHQKIEGLLASSQEHEEVMRGFSEQIESRKKQLDEQEKKTAEYEKQLELYTNERKEKLAEAEDLIEQARNALEYRTAQGLSAAFSERYDEYKKQKTGWWLVGAFALLLCSVASGGYLFLMQEGRGFFIDLFRIVIMSAFFSGAWFCSAQYVKHKNTMEDYGYKAALAKSIIGFLGRINGEERGSYLAIVLSEIHRDPLRKRHDVSDSAGQSLRNALQRKQKNLFSGNS